MLTANGAGTVGLATAAAEFLTELGYAAQPVDVEELVDGSAVFYADGRSSEAARLAADLGWAIDAIAPFADLPELTGDPAPFDLVAVIGLDNAALVEDR